MLKQKIIKILSLNELYESTSQFDISVLELIMIQLSNLLQQKKETNETGIQVELINKDKTVNNQLLNELRIAEVRKSVEENEKKHYHSMLATLEKQLKITITDQVKREYDGKIKEMKKSY